ncbi:hypothetical protein C4580_06045 [Candidatus Woesearchaeota archaeon]|nr:MAG: hypothetical protein C4580_06045 [Candidatus Woesearchaeota archaeon]
MNLPKSILVLVLLLAAGCSPNDKTSFIQCLAEHGIEIYGTEHCSSCRALSRSLGNSYPRLTSFECDPYAADSDYPLCAEKNITVLPTIILPNGERLSGKIRLETLAEKTGCELP